MSASATHADTKLQISHAEEELDAHHPCWPGICMSEVIGGVITKCNDGLSHPCWPGVCMSEVICCMTPSCLLSNKARLQ